MMSDSEEERQLQQAIALSLGQSPEVPDIVDLTGDTPPARRSNGHGHSTSIQIESSRPAGLLETDSNTGSGSHAIEQHPRQIVPSAPGILGIDRRRQEEERLARLARKRKERSLSPPEIHRGPAKTLKTDTKRPVCDLDSAKSGEGESGNRLKLSETPAKTFTPPFPHGIVRKTWVFGQARASDIKIEEVFQRNELKIAVLSSFQWDMEWLLSKINIHKTKLVLIMQAKDEATKHQYRSETAGMSQLRLCFPPMDGQINCMHSKLQLLFYQDYLRLVIPSANLVPYDWGETGAMENSVFLIDLPRSQMNSDFNVNSDTSFRAALLHFLEAEGLDEDIIEGVMRFDFSETKDLGFVHTIGGAHTGSNWRKTGYCGLGKTVQELGLNISQPLDVDFITSSVGSLNMEFIEAIFLAAHGDDGLMEYNRRVNGSHSRKKDRGKSATDIDEALLQSARDNFRIYFPSNETVKNSIGGPASAGTVCFQRKWWDSATFPRGLMRDCKSVRDKLLMHNKILFARFPSPVTAGHKTYAGWAYVGSANLSESAWGRLVKDRATKSPKLNCRNWECGILIPVPKTEGTQGLGIFEGVVPVPMQYPGQSYEGKTPWFYTGG